MAGHRPSTGRRGVPPRCAPAVAALALSFLAGGLGFNTPAATGAPAPAAPPAPARRSLVIPVPLPPAMPAAATLECVVADCGSALPLSGLAFGPGGKTLAVGGYGEVVLWDLAAAKLGRRLGAGQLEGMAQAVRFSKDGKSLAVGDGDPAAAGSVKVFALDSGQVTAKLDGPKGAVSGLDLSPDGKLLAAASGDGAAYVWDLATGAAVATLKFHKAALLTVAFASDGKYLVTGGADRTVQVWDTATWQPDKKETHLEDVVRRCALRSSRPQGTETQHLFALLVGGRENRSLQVRLDDKAPAWARKDVRLDLTAGTPLDCQWASVKGANQVYVACTDGTVKLFAENKTTFDPVATMAGHRDWVYAVALDQDGSRLASAAGDGTVKLWATADNRLLGTMAQLAPATDDWLIVGGAGHFAGSAPDRVQWRATGFTAAPDKLAALNDPEAARKSLAGETVPAPAW